MPRRNPRPRLKVGIPILLGLLVSMATCTGPIDLLVYPTLFFEGQVLREGGAGVHSTVWLYQRFTGCDPINQPFARSTETDDEGVYRLEHYAAAGLDGCLVLAAFSLDRSLMPLDSLILTATDLHQLGDPLGTGLINVNIIIATAAAALLVIVVHNRVRTKLEQRLHLRLVHFQQRPQVSRGI